MKIKVGYSILKSHYSHSKLKVVSKITVNLTQQKTHHKILKMRTSLLN